MRHWSVAALSLLFALVPHLSSADATRADAWWAHVEALANDEMEGRAAGSPGYDRAAAYVVAQLKALGLEPAGVDGYYQPIDLIEQKVLVDRSSAALVGPGGEVTLAVPDDIFFRGSIPIPEAVQAPLFFAGYGLRIPEAGIDDFAGVDLKGKIVVVMSGGPANVSGALKSHSRSTRPKELHALGAIGVIELTSPQQVEIPWGRQKGIARQAMTGVADPEVRDVAAPFLLGYMDPAKSQSLFTGAEHDFASLAALSDASRTLPHFALKQSFKSRIVAERRTLRSANVLARLQGSDPKLSGEYVVLSAHLDGLGIGAPIAGDSIYNSAFDNAIGVASVIEIARSLQAATVAPRRSILFAILTGEERGLFGSRYFTARPTVPIRSMVADLNFDMPLPIFPLKSITALGDDQSSLGEDAKAVAASMGLAMLPDPFPDRNAFIRSDQYNFVRRGIPSLFFRYGFAPGTPEAEAAQAWRTHIYHSPRDDLSQPVLKTEAIKLNDYVQALTLRIANADARPHWNADSFFIRFAQ